VIRAHAVVRVEAAADGSPMVVELRSAVPLVLRRTGVSGWPPTSGTSVLPAPVPILPAPPALPTVTVYLVSAAAGPLAGDTLRLDVSVGPGVRLVLRSVAATLAMPGHGPGPSTMEIRAEVEAGGALDLLPEPTVAVRGCAHRMIGQATVAAGGWLRWREEILLGRFGEPAGAIDTDLWVDVLGPAAHSPLLRQQLPLRPDTPGLAGPALLGGARAVGSLLVAAPDPAGDGTAPAGLGLAAAVDDGVALLPLAGPGVLVSAVADDAVSLRRRLGP
jgi:urease accessory protein